MNVPTAEAPSHTESPEAKVKRLNDEIPTSPTESKETISDISKEVLAVDPYNSNGNVKLITSDSGQGARKSADASKEDTASEQSEEDQKGHHNDNQKDQNPAGGDGDRDEGSGNGDDEGGDGGDDNDNGNGKDENEDKKKDINKKNAKTSDENEGEETDENGNERVVTAVEKGKAELLMGWVMHKVENREEIFNSFKEKAVETYEAYKEAEELNRLKRKYKKDIKADKQLQKLDRKIMKLKKQLKAQRLNGDRQKKRNEFKREKEQKHLDKQTTKLKKTLHTFSHGSTNVHEYAKAMMRASARMKKLGFLIRGTDKVLAMEAAVLRNMHRMMSLQKQFSLARKHCKDVSSFMKRCKTWLDNKYADGVMHLATLNATQQAMRIMYQETLEVQQALMPKFEDPANHTFKEREELEEKLPPGMTKLPDVKSSSGPMIITLDGSKPVEKDERPDLDRARSSRRANMMDQNRKKSSSKANARAMAAAWDATMKQYESLLVVGGEDMKIIDDVSDLGDSDEEIESRLLDIDGMVKAAKASEGVSSDTAEKEKGDTKKEQSNEKEVKKSDEDEKDGAEDQDEDPVVEGEEGVQAKQEKLDKMLDENDVEGDSDSDGDNASVEAELDHHLEKAVVKAVYNEDDPRREAEIKKGEEEHTSVSHTEGLEQSSLTKGESTKEESEALESQAKG